MRITIFGSGYVGLVTGACFAEVGNHVICVDINAERVAGLNRGEVPIFEPGLAPMLTRNHKAGRLEFTTDADSAVAHAKAIFIAVGTPPNEDGSSDLQYVEAVARTIGKTIASSKVVVDKSTVPVGTADLVRSIIAGELALRNVDVRFDVVSNPEFLKEGAAVDDFMRPDRIVIGSDTNYGIAVMQELYAPFNRNHGRMLVMDVRSAEFTKYAANAMLATKISFMNELANIADRVGVDIESVRIGIGSDPRIGYSFIYPGIGYGGSCFPKDVRALERTAASVDYDAPLLRAVETVNNRQKHVLFDKITSRFGQDLSGLTFAVWGLAFKPNTDDMREAPSRALIEALWGAGAQVRAHDPEAMKEAARLYPTEVDSGAFVLCDDEEEALNEADALVICTEWRAFRAPDFEELKTRLKNPVMFDGRNIHDPARMQREGVEYHGIGLAAARPAGIPVTAA